MGPNKPTVVNSRVPVPETADDAWILDIVVLKWTKLDPYIEYKPHLWHTACRTQEGQVVVFGGCTNNILSLEEPTEHSNELLIFSLNPLSLLRMCLDTVYKYKAWTYSDWAFLPKSLATWLQMKNDVMMLDKKDNIGKETRDTGQSVGTTCIVA